MPLVEIGPGWWVRPELVTAVIARKGYDGKEGKYLPCVHVRISETDSAIGWEFDTWDEARAFAATIVTKVNEAVP
jgi:hypothetical protein